MEKSLEFICFYFGLNDIFNPDLKRSKAFSMEVFMNIMTQEKGLAPWIQAKMDELMSHPAWQGEVSGLEAEALLRQHDSFTYLLRQGEKADQFYLSYINGTDLLHLPFTIDYSSLQWFYRNSWPHFAADLKAFIPEIMHRDEAECHPLAQFITTS
jgi:hypothetical protein